MISEDINIKSIKLYPPPQIELDGATTIFRQLLRLDSVYKPGLKLSELKVIFSKCSSCGLIMTKRVFSRHICDITEVKDGREYIDLTLDEDWISICIMCLVATRKKCMPKWCKTVSRKWTGDKLGSSNMVRLRKYGHRSMVHHTLDLSAVSLRYLQTSEICAVLPRSHGTKERRH